jgi:hypothetical protein
MRNINILKSENPELVQVLLFPLYTWRQKQDLTPKPRGSCLWSQTVGGAQILSYDSEHTPKPDSC